MIAGIIWIGLLYFLNLINAHVTAALQVPTRREVVPQIMPRVLFWFRWGAMFTFITGVLLIFWKYFLLGSGFGGDAGLFGSERGLVDFDGSTLWHHHVVQRVVHYLASPAKAHYLGEGRPGPPEQPQVAKTALYASRTNVFLSVPMLFGMLAGAGHYPTISFFPWFLIVIALGAGLVYYMLFTLAPTVAKELAVSGGTSCQFQLSVVGSDGEASLCTSDGWHFSFGD